MSILMYMLRRMKQSQFSPIKVLNTDAVSKSTLSEKEISPRMQEFKKKLRQTTPIRHLEELDVHPHQEKEPLPQWPDNKNPHTGEIGGPKGPEPTRYGDWERKGRVTDF